MQLEPFDDPPHPAIDKALVFSAVAAELTAHAGETGSPRIAERMRSNAVLARSRVRSALGEVVGGGGG